MENSAEIFSPEWLTLFSNVIVTRFTPTSDVMFPHFVNFTLSNGRKGFINLSGLELQVGDVLVDFSTLDIFCPELFLTTLFDTHGHIAKALDAACESGTFIVEQTSIDEWFQSIFSHEVCDDYYAALASITKGCR